MPYINPKKSGFLLALLLTSSFTFAQKKAVKTYSPNKLVIEKGDALFSKKLCRMS
jgi:hypothetical protein